MHNLAIIVAAGLGSRFGSLLPKQFVQVSGKPVLRWSTEAFIKHPMIDGVCIAIPDGCVEVYNSAVEGLNLLPFIIGGALRQDTIRNALEAVSQYKPKKVLIHDAARPLVTSTIITDAVRALDSYLAVDVVLPITDTVKRLDIPLDSAVINAQRAPANKLTAQQLAIINREYLYRTQTPQCFDFNTILQLYRRCKSGIIYTDDISICIEAGIEVGLIWGDVCNHKITIEDDLGYVSYMLSKRLNVLH